VGLKVAVNMEKWRSIDYEKELKRELKRIEKVAFLKPIKN